MNPIHVERLLLTSFSILITLWTPQTLGAQGTFPLPPAKVGVPYQFSIQTEGGLPPFKWQIIDGDLPPGIQLLPTGELKGTPNSPRQQPFEFVVEAADSEQPAQRFIQRFSLSVAPSELRIVVQAAPLKMITQVNSAGVHSEPSPSSARMNAVLTPTSYSPSRPPHWVIPLQPAAARAPQLSSTNDAQEKPGKYAKTAKDTLDPSNFIEVDEDTKTGSHWTLYKPGGRSAGKKARQLTADLESSILIVPDPSLMGDDPTLNKLYVTAKLASGDSSKEIAVTGYSEVGKDKAAMPAQSGTAFQSAANVEAMILNMAYTVSDIIRNVYSPPQLKGPGPESNSQNPPQLRFQEWLDKHKEMDLQSKMVVDTDAAIAKAIQSKQYDDPNLQRVRDRFRLYQPEVQAISAFFVQNENLELVERVGVEVFWIDRDSLLQIAQQFKTNTQVAFDSKSTPEAQAQALQDMLERTKLVYKDFGDFRREVRDQMMRQITTETQTEGEWNARFQEAILAYSDDKRKQAFKQLKNFLATGSISLPDNQVKDGDRLTVTVESLPAGSTTGGIPVVFEIVIKKYGAKIQWSPSLLFVRRLGVTDAEASPPTGSVTAPLNRINFAPSPGMTFGIAYFKRGNSDWDKFVRGLGPGMGMNVTFMNFNDPSFNLATTQFVNTSGTNVQVGAGLIGSLFDNKLQLSYGWNLNVERRRTYFGVGFGFIEIGKEVAKYVTK